MLCSSGVRFVGSGVRFVVSGLTRFEVYEVLKKPRRTNLTARVAERGEEVLAGEASRWTLQPCEGNVCEFEKLESGACRRRAGAGAEE